MANIGTMGLLKFQKLVKRLGIPAYAVLGALETLWQYGHMHAPDEMGVRFTAGDVELVIGWEGEPGTLEAALLEFRWLDRDGDGALIIHDYPANMPPFVRKRFERRAVKVKEKGDGEQGGPSGQRPDMSRQRPDMSRKAKGTETEGELGVTEPNGNEEEAAPGARSGSGSAALNAGGEGPEHVGAAAARYAQSTRKSVEAKVREILSVTGEPPEYAAFWESNIRTALEHDREHGTSLYTELAEAVIYAQDCVRNGREKDLGPLTNPGALIVKRITPVFHAYGVKLARPPESAKPKPTPTRAGA